MSTGESRSADASEAAEAGGRATTPDSDEPFESNAEVPVAREPSGWAATPWYRTRVGLAIVGLDVALTVALALLTTSRIDVGVPAVSTPGLGTIPAHVYGFSLLGALGFVFTALIEHFDSDTARLIRYNFRLPAALPLGAGVFLLSDVILGTSTNTAPVVLGLVFLSGLYVNLAYKRLGALARRLLPDSSTSTIPSESGGSAGSGSGGDSTAPGRSADGRGRTPDD